MRNDFLTFLDALMEANPSLVEELMTDSLSQYINDIHKQKSKPALTDKGKLILAYLQDQIPEGPFKSADVANGLGIAARGVSGSLRKLVLDGFCDKVETEPIMYELTEKGRNYDLKENE